MYKIALPIMNTSQTWYSLFSEALMLNTWEEIQNPREGGVTQGTLARGLIKPGKVVKIRPVIFNKTSNNWYDIIPIYCKIVSQK